jgi:hypothetical protein
MQPQRFTTAVKFRLGAIQFAYEEVCNQCNRSLSRVALLLRSAEIKPLFSRFVLLNISPLIRYPESLDRCGLDLLVFD